jgi:hypothetical protein
MAGKMDGFRHLLGLPLLGPSVARLSALISASILVPMSCLGEHEADLRPFVVKASVILSLQVGLVFDPTDR